MASFAFQILQDSISAGDPAKGGYDTPANPIVFVVGWGGDTSPLDAFGVEARCLQPQCAPKPNFWIRPWLTPINIPHPNLIVTLKFY